MEKHRSPHLLFVIIQTDGTRQLLDSSKQSSCLSKSNGKSRRPPGPEKPRASRIRMMPWLERPREVCDPPSRTRDSPRRFPVGPSEVAPGAGGTSTGEPFRGPRLFLATEHAIHGERRRPGIQLCESHTVNVAQDPTPLQIHGSKLLQTQIHSNCFKTTRTYLASGSDPSKTKSE
ncbi:Hypothetical predicted protein [Lynx pardinus]|uniref:Uncharacterized protein n=1 Tax=Lynx pardinus TaxID=191816 RepID=A0A485NXH2_LYNPA|nr:Hypothetical predicted protein [Lynx pardinus]